MRALFLLLCPGLLAAADLSGIWAGEIPTRNGETQDITFQFVQNTAGKITGKLYGDYGSSPIVEGKMTGDDVDFVVVASEQAGNQINTSRLRFTGKHVVGVLMLTRTRESSKNAGNAGDVQTRQNTPVSFCMRRLADLKPAAAPVQTSTR